MAKEMDWGSLNFGYHPTEKRYVSNFREGAWDGGVVTEDAMISIHESAAVLQYAQTVFEGLKAYTTRDGHIVCFRPEQNAARMADSCRRMMIPELPEGRFVEAVCQTVLANREWVPPYGSGAALYLRPFIFGSGAVLGVRPSEEYQFRVFASPVGPYFKGQGGPKALRLTVSPYDRAAPHGTGHIKAGLNYAMSLYVGDLAHRSGFDENLYLDPATRTTVEETGGANVLFVTKDGKLVTPKSDSILPSITRRSLMQVGRDILGLTCEERPIPLLELGDMAECGLCGTAAVISPVGTIVDGSREYSFDTSDEGRGPIIRKLYETLTGIQMGTLPAPEGWVKVIE